jgi:hypothetical protein
MFWSLTAWNRRLYVHYSTDGKGPSSNKFKYQQSFLKKEYLYFNTKSTYAHAIVGAQDLYEIYAYGITAMMA